MANCLRAAEGFREDMVPKALHKSFKPLAESIVIEAYSSPKYHTSEVQMEESVEFGNRVMLECVKGVRGISP